MHILLIACQVLTALKSTLTTESFQEPYDKGISVLPVLEIQEQKPREAAMFKVTQLVKCWGWDGFNWLKDFLTRVLTPWQVLATGIAKLLGKSRQQRPGQGNVFKVLSFSPCPGQEDAVMFWSLSRLSAQRLSFLFLTRGHRGLMWTGKIYPVTSELIFV